MSLNFGDGWCVVALMTATFYLETSQRWYAFRRKRLTRDATENPESGFSMGLISV